MLVQCICRTPVWYTHTPTPRAKLAYPIHLHACFWEVGGNPHRHDMGRKHSELYRDINPGSGSNHGTWSYETWRQPAVLPVEKQLTPISSFPNFLSSMNINNSPPQPTEEDGEGWRSRFLNLPCVWVVKIFNWLFHTTITSCYYICKSCAFRRSVLKGRLQEGLNVPINLKSTTFALLN